MSHGSDYRKYRNIIKTSHQYVYTHSILNTHCRAAKYDSTRSHKIDVFNDKHHTTRLTMAAITSTQSTM